MSESHEEPLSFPKRVLFFDHLPWHYNYNSVMLDKKRTCPLGQYCIGLVGIRVRKSVSHDLRAPFAAPCLILLFVKYVFEDVYVILWLCRKDTARTTTTNRSGS
jgi:hypothetical protein